MNTDKKQYLSVIYNSIVPFLYAFGCKMTKNTALIEDSIHDVFLHLCEEEDISGIRNMKAYLLSAVKHALLEKFASRAPLKNIDDISQNLLLEPSIEDHLLESERIEKYKKNIAIILKRLTPQQQRAIYLYYIEQRSYDEICQILEMNKQSAWNLIHQSLSRLREKLGERSPEF